MGKHKRPRRRERIWTAAQRADVGRRLARARLEKHAVPPEPMTDVIPENENEAAHIAVFKEVSGEIAAGLRQAWEGQPENEVVQPLFVGEVHNDWGIKVNIINDIPKRPLTWNDLPRDTRKSAKRPGIPENAPVYRMRCIRCRLDMWTRDHKKEDICETCEYIMIDEKHRLRGTHERSRGGEFVNPFADVTDTSPNVNPLVGGNTRLL